MQPDRVDILVVDDSPDKLCAMEVVLSELGQNVVSARSGEEALRRLLNNDFAVILLDVNMPGMDGFETASMIRNRPRSEHTPIIFVTAMSEETHAAHGYSLGAVDYILAPNIPEVLRAKVSVFVELYKKNREIERRADERVALAEAQAARAEAEQANRAKSAFLANISHELRTPMNAIIGMTDLALDEQLSATVRDYLQTARDSADVLLALLNEILDFSRIEAGKLELESIAFDVRATVEQTARVLAPRAEQKGLALFSQIAGDLPHRVWGDPLRLRQVLMNLLGNAIKFTQEGHIDVAVGLDHQTSGVAHLSFAVHDTGIGISNLDQKRIFSPFTQADSSTTRLYGGTGLGLAISSSLVSMMGGRISVRSDVGHGSTFTFTVPFRTEGVETPQPFSHPPMPREAGPREAVTHEALPHESSPHATTAGNGGSRPLRVLLAEDTRANQKLIRTILSRRGHDVRVVGDGRQAVDAVASDLFDIILMDVQMPVMDGFQATAAIRDLRPQLSPRIPIVALTAYAMRDDQERCLSAGMDAYLAKPIDCRELVELVESLGHRG